MDSFKKRKICKFSVERILFEIFNILFQDNVEEKEGDKILLRRERNRVAATKCRNKKKVKLNIIIGKAEAIEKSNNLLMQDIYRLEAEKRQLVRLLMMKKKGRLDSNPDSSEDNSSSEQVDIFSLLDNFTPQTYNI